MSDQMQWPQRLAGFTLLEVLVALFVVTIGMTAVYIQVGQYADTASYTRDKTLASWIASNRLTELGIQGGWPELGRQSDELEFAGRLWQLEISIAETEVENLRRVEVAVSLAEDPAVVIHRVAALIEPSPPRGFAPLRWLDAAGGDAG